MNLVVPIERDDAVWGYVHSTPISMEVFDIHHKVISTTVNGLLSNGLFAPRTAHLELRDVAKALKAWDGPTGVQMGLVNEIHRLTNLLIPGERGWEMVPYDEAVKRDLLDDEEKQQIEGAITFFTLAWRTYPIRIRQAMTEGAASMWAARTVSSSCSEFLSSLPTSTADASTGVRAVA